MSNWTKKKKKKIYPTIEQQSTETTTLPANAYSTVWGDLLIGINK